MKSFALAIVTAFAIVNGAHAASAPARAANAFLSQADASARVANVDYVLDFTLTGKESFSATTTLNFDLADTEAPP